MAEVAPASHEPFPSRHPQLAAAFFFFFAFPLRGQESRRAARRRIAAVLGKAEELYFSLFSLRC